MDLTNENDVAFSYGSTPPNTSPESRYDKTTKDNGAGSLGTWWRNQLSTVVEALMGRHGSQGGDGLNASISPEWYGATDDLTSFNARQRLDVEDGSAPANHHTHASMLVNQLNPRQLARRKGGKQAQSGTSTAVSTPDGERMGTPVDGSILSQLLRSYADYPASESRYSLTDGTQTPDHDVTESETEAAGVPKKSKNNRPNIKWYNSQQHLAERASTPTPWDRKKQPKHNRQAKLTKHIANLLARQQYIMQLCRTLMMYGAPTHRLEEYMTMTASVLDIKAQFLYIPGCMFMSFDDVLTRTADVKIIRVVQGLDLSRLAATHNVYKNVVHDLIPLEQATEELDEIMKSAPRYNRWLVILFMGLASVAVGPYAFSARPIDLPIIFVLGILVGFMQQVIAPASSTYANVLEVSAAILTSFLARAFGSIKHNGEYLFCFSAIAQSAIAMILPGFAVLSSSLELQSHQMNAGSIRLVYTIIYSLFLGYGVTVGTTIYGLMDPNATTQTECPANSLEAAYGSKYVQHFPFVALFCLFAALTNQSKLKQLPVTVGLGVCGYVTNYFSTTKLGPNQVANTVGAFTIGLMANLYSRIWHGHAAAIIIPGIFTLVPSGLASSGSIISGLDFSEQIKHNSTTSSASKQLTNSNSLTALGYGMIQTAIGISVGLFMSALIVYPHGKKRSGIFSL
ncbi:hypothetical protein VFPPC_10892 [Pochonia chlamydosporia 170]|uniref:DUF1212 domain membrane protein n=1 Tax=Pochonia chlamydosporia 170 TaxID=1380566 RepID=A0A179EYY0_METCM|nr:hypothetical protein VFPPC_10892 [Pochonia chlamydosporia 170]OAQ58381.1 hypothetical protein VFPPC_10892 [Pochonia chlamydosporia 170]